MPGKTSSQPVVTRVVTLPDKSCPAPPRVSLLCCVGNGLQDRPCRQRSQSRVQDSLIKRIAGHENGVVTFSVYESSSPLKAMLEARVQINLHIDLGRRGILRQNFYRCR